MVDDEEQWIKRLMESKGRDGPVYYGPALRPRTRWDDLVAPWESWYANLSYAICTFFYVRSSRIARDSMRPAMWPWKLYRVYFWRAPEFEVYVYALSRQGAKYLAHERYDFPGLRHSYLYLYAHQV